jgi:ubiquinone/menaquinone biosynthesis C-methylase UbiE
MATQVDPAGVMPGTILKAADFREVNVLEIGAGNGRLTYQYATQARSVVGIDINGPDIRSASRNAPIDQRGNVRFLCASATALPFVDERFGIVLLASSL